MGKAKGSAGVVESTISVVERHEIVTLVTLGPDEIRDVLSAYIGQKHGIVLDDPLTVIGTHWHYGRRGVAESFGLSAMRDVSAG